MKKLSISILCICLALSLCACGTEKKPATGSDLTWEQIEHLADQKPAEQHLAEEQDGESEAAAQD